MPSGAAISCSCARWPSARSGVVDGRERRAGQLELAAGLERDRPAAGPVGEADDVPPSMIGSQPSWPHALEQGGDAARSAIGDWSVACELKGNFSCSVPIRKASSGF